MKNIFSADESVKRKITGLISENSTRFKPPLHFGAKVPGRGDIMGFIVATANCTWIYLAPPYFAGYQTILALQCCHHTRN